MSEYIRAFGDWFWHRLQEKPIYLWRVERVVFNALANRRGFAA